jgi:hypothetical protein
MVTVPKRFEKNVTEAGKFRKVNKVIAFGEEKSGKSRFASGFPGPLGVVDTGEGGIQMYLDPKRDTCLTSTHPAECAEIIKWLCEEARKDSFRTLVVDSGTLFWDMTKEEAYEKLGDKRAEFQDWSWIKKPVNKALYELMRVPANVIITAWVNETRMEKEESTVRGKEAKTKIKKSNTADLERKYGYLFDLAFSMRRGVNDLLEPDGTYSIAFWGGRVPASIPSSMIYPGKRWEFDSLVVKSPGEIYEEVIGWMLPYKEAGGTMTLLGMDEGDEGRVRGMWEDLVREAEDEKVGKVLRILAGMTSMDDYTRRAQTELGPIVSTLSKDQMVVVQKFIDQRKAELKGD